MKQRRTTEELDALLDRGGLGAYRRDSILETVLEHVECERPARSRWRWSVAGLGAVAAAAAMLFMVVPRHTSNSIAGSAFRAKGPVATPRAAAPSVTIECLAGTPAGCPSGSLLVVRVVGVRGYLSAWAELVGGGERVWYFSAENSSPMIDGIAANAAATSRAVKIGPEHKTETYIVEIRVTDQPMARSELLHLPAGAALVAGRVPLTVTSP
jgi:hypothetical protein